MLVSVQTDALAAGTCMIPKDACVIAGGKSTGRIPGQFCRHAVQRGELMGVADRSQAMTIWSHTCRPAAIVRSTLFGAEKFKLLSCAVSHGTSVCKPLGYSLVYCARH